jgi:hypothetical protein
MRCGPYITRLSAWAPGIESPGDWDEWAQDKRKIASGGNGPEIAFTDSLFRRRLSQISKMTVQVVHDLLPVKEETKIFFISFRGELSRQYQINKMMIKEKAMMPAAFSLSVFNAPAALASIAFGLKGGYSAIYPGNNSFAAGLMAAEAFLFGATSFPKETEELIFVYADEELPPEYRCFFQEYPPSLAFGLLLSREPKSLSIPLSSFKGMGSPEGSPLDFIKRILLYGKIHVAS